VAVSPSAQGDKPAIESDPSAGAIFNTHRRTQIAVFLAAALCFLLFWKGGQWLHIPAEPGFQASLLQQPNWPLAIGATYVMVAAAVVIGTLIGGRFWFFAGLFSATIGLMALSARGGPMRFVLFDAAAHGAAQRVFLRLFVEQCLLFFPIALIWTYLWRHYQAAIPVVEPAEGGEEPAPSTALAVLAQLAIMGAALLLLAPTDAKKQVLVAVFLAGFVGTSLGDYLFPHRKAAAWYWVGPLVVGAVGYLLAHSNATPWTNGNPAGSFAALARPLPLDYASAGCAGTLLGYWLGSERPDLSVSLLGALTTGTIVIRRKRFVSAPPSPPANEEASSVQQKTPDPIS
jgi:hypothetical protein